MTRLLVAFGALTVAACGARTELVDPDAGQCVLDEDCDDRRVCNGSERCVEGRCRAGVAPDCDDRDPCTHDECVEPGDPTAEDAGRRDAGAGGCVHRVLREDRDGDGFDGVMTELPAICGDDCDDDDPLVFPGASERCNGRDDDCDGQVDEGASYMPEGNDVRLTFDDTPSSYGGLAWNPISQTWATTYWDYAGGSADISFLELDETGTPRAAPVLLTLDTGDAFGAQLVWTGREHGAVWQDRRDGDYEVYFNRLAPDGSKLGPDYRVTYAPGWSINTALAWTGSEYVIAWQDGRHEIEAVENYEIYMTFLDRDGFEIGDDIRLTNDLSNSEAPAIDIGGDEIGVAFLDGRNGVQQIWFLTTDLQGTRTSAEVVLSTALGSARARDPVVVWADGAFVVVWEQESLAGDTDIVAVRIPRAPIAPIEGPTALAGGDSFARGPSLLSNGDRLVLAFADDRDGDFDLWAAVYDPRLSRITPDVRVSRARGDGVYPLLRRGGTSIGVISNDQRDGNWEVYFTRLLCAGP